MALTAAQLSALKVEFSTDPRGYGYAANWTNGFDGGLPPIINAVRDGVVRNSIPLPTTPTGASGAADGKIKLNNLVVDTGAIRTAVTLAAYNGLTTGNRTWFNWLTGAGNITVTTDLLQTLAGIPTASGSVWAAGDTTAMNAAMEALLRKYGSRAEELFGFGVAVTTDDVTKAHTAA